MESYIEKAVMRKGEPIYYGDKSLFLKKSGLPESINTEVSLSLHSITSSFLRIHIEKINTYKSLEDFILLVEDSHLNNKSLLHTSSLMKFNQDNHFKEAYIILPNNPKEIYGHWLIDILPMAVFARNKLSNYKIKFLYFGNLKSFIVDLINEFNFIEEDLISINNLNHEIEIIKMSRARDHDYLNTNFFSDYLPNNLHNNYLNNFCAKKIYVSRSRLRAAGINSRDLLNRSDIETIYKKHHFSIIYPEELSIKQQILLFYNADVVAGEAGSGLHNSIFTLQNKMIINLQSARQDHLIQASLCALFDQKSIYILGKPESNDWMSNFWIDPALVETALQDIL
jgi:hypothetical protein